MAAMAAAADDYCTTGALSSFAGEPSVFLLRRHHDRDTTARTEYDGRRGSEKKRNRCRVRVARGQPSVERGRHVRKRIWFGPVGMCVATLA
jgi:hypothetical protein